MKDYEKYDDKQLIALININGNDKESAFKEIFNRYAKLLFIYCREKTEDLEAAKDLHQEI